MRDYETMRSLLTFISFWSSADLTGNQTNANSEKIAELFWSSADLTGNQTPEAGYDLFQQDPDEWTGPKKRMA